ncbi:MAG: acylphosphatase [Chloroflexota bacterium]
MGAVGGPMITIRLEATVHGVVTGVGFRVFAFDAARALGLTGWVANDRTGTVRCVAEGERSDLDALVRMLERGPAGSIVDRVSAVFMPSTGSFRGFEIRSSWHGGD